ncbi:hypothetical protein ACRYCC_22970 [Actinomadura scrupuli]|uniref:hypothetical protein n=1 Tax=Actinomadura scrupuli TaxID=559629 RepID=UPI003D957C6C
MGVMEVDRVHIPPAGAGPRTSGVIRGRPWTDPVLDEAIDAVRDRYLRVAVAALAETRHDPELRSLRVEALAKAAIGLSHGIESLLQADPGNPDLWLWLGRTRVEEAWGIRPAPRGRAVQAAAYKAFSKMMQSARDPLMRAAERLPDDPVPWESMMWVGLALEFEPEDKEMLWRQAERRCPTLYGAHVVRVLSLSPQWGGLAEAMFDFARLSMSMAAREDPRAALIPLAYFEFFVQERSGIIRGASSWFSDQEIRDVESAARGWFSGVAGRGGPGDPRRPRPHPRTIEAHNLFGAAFHLGDARRPARQHLNRTNGRPSRLPWTYLGGNEVDQYTKACRQLNLHG